MFYVLKINDKYVKQVCNTSSNFAAVVSKHFSEAVRYNSYEEVLKQKEYLFKHPMLKNPVKIYKVIFFEEEI